MDMVYLWSVAGYFIIVWVGVRLVVPHLGFRKNALPAELPAEFAAMVRRIDTEAADDFDFLKRAYAYVTSTYSGSRIRTLGNFWVAFEDPINHVPGFLPCTCQNYILRTLLVKSGRFQESEIQVKVVPLNLFIHQYLCVKIGSDTIDVDPWSAFIGIQLGKKSAFFG